MDIRIPAVGESVFEALVAKWHKNQGEAVRKDEAICEIETDKITMELNAEADGTLSIVVPAGTTVKIGTVIGSIAEGAVAAAVPTVPPTVAIAEAPPVADVAAEPLPPAAEAVAGFRSPSARRAALQARATATATPPAAPAPAPSAPAAAAVAEAHPASLVRSEEPVQYAARPVDDRVTRQRMTPIRKRIAERLVAVRQQTAMLTTFNEADMGRVMEVRTRHKEHFLKKHGVALGYMSFFVKACVEALREFPAVNARIDGDDLVFHHYHNIGVAIGGEKGLVVPVLRDADRLHFAGIEGAIAGYIDRVKTNRLELSDLEGGTFTISNGGVYGSLLSTPILNTPQSGVLGMHAIQERPVARDGQVVIRPMMYLALSYDHRIIDGRDAVSFLKTVKEYIENPEEMLLEG
jgi:2-oxoglutarate dehydrogenase E2 component (dihydrolipoamide succinyltransferase)